jgi:hypothetical protein
VKEETMRYYTADELKEGIILTSLNAEQPVLLPNNTYVMLGDLIATVKRLEEEAS